MYKYELVKVEKHIPAMILIQNLTGNDRCIPLHWHRSLEIDLILEGRMKVTVDGQESEVYPGDIFCVNSEKLHSMTPVESDVIRSITVVLAYDFIKLNYPSFDKKEFNIHTANFPKKELKKLMYQIKEVYEDDSESKILELNLLLSQLLLMVIKNAEIVVKSTILKPYDGDFDYRVKLAISYLKENYMNEISIATILDKVHLTHAAFSRLFKKETGLSFNAMLINYRLQKAHQDLVSSELSLTDIALKNGFTSLDNFRIHFKNVYQISPSQYRKL